MLGTQLVWRLVNKRPETRYTALVLNEKGLDQATSENIPHVEMYVSASHTHSVKNTGTRVEKALADVTRMIGTAVTNGLGVTAGVMCAFGCFYEGPVSIESVLRIIERFEENHPDEIVLADTTGMGQPQRIMKMIESVERITGIDRIGIHLHDTHGLGFANLKAALEMGVRRFDTSVGGLGGCPFIPDAEGNISTERTVQTVESLGFITGIDVKKIIRVRERLEQLLVKSLPTRKTEPDPELPAKE